MLPTRSSKKDTLAISWYNGAPGATSDRQVKGRTAITKLRIRAHPELSWIILALCLLAFARGVYQLGEQSLWWDESLSLHRATHPFPFILSNRILFLFDSEEQPVTPDHHPPLYFVLLRVLVLVAGKSEFVLRYLSLAACVLIVPLLYQCGRRLFGSPTGIGAALLAACSPLYLWAQQEARPYALGTLFAVSSFYALLRMVDSPPAAPSRHWLWRDQTRWGALYALSTLAMLATHYHSFQLLPAQAAIYLLARDHRRDRTRWAVLATGAAAAVIGLYGLLEILPPADLPGYNPVSFGTLVQDVLRSFPLGVSGTHLVAYQWVSVGLLVAALVVLFTRPAGQTRRHAAYLLIGFALPVLGMYAFLQVRSVYMNIRHLIFASPFYYLLLGAGVAQARHIRLGGTLRVPASVPLGLALAVLLVGMGLSTDAYFVDPLYDKEDHRGWGEYLTEHVRPGDAVIVYPGADYELYTYYSSSPAPYYGFPMYLGASPEKTADRLTELGQQFDRVWVAHSLTPGWASAGDVTLDWLKEHAVRVAYAEFSGHLNTFPVYAFRLEPMIVDELPESAAPLGLDFDGQLRLLGFHSVDDPVTAGQPLRLSLYWSAVHTLQEEYRFTLSLTDEAGYTWASLDYLPYDGTYLPTRWPVGRIVRDDVDIELPPGAPPGSYALNVSVYPADGGGPALPVRELAGDRLMGLVVPIAEVAVARPDRPALDAVDPIPRRANQRYGDLALVGYGPVGGTYEPGEFLYLDLYWQARRAPRGDLAFGLQLVDERGEVRVTRAIAAVEGYPSSRWRKGELVEGKHRLRLPLDLPAGKYTVGLAPGEGRTLFPLWPWGSRRVQLGALSLLPLSGDHAFELPPMGHELRANLGDQVELLGYDLETQNVQPGQVVSVTLYWRGLEEMSRSYTVFTHLVGPDGQTWGQWDNEPQRGQAPTTRWVPGEVVADPYEIPLDEEAQEGPLTLYVGMYDLLTMTRLPLLDGSGAPAGDSIAVAELTVVSEGD